MLSVSKLYFAYGLGNALFFPLLAGCRAVLLPGHPAAADVAATVRRYGVTVLFSVPTFYAGVVAAGGAEAFTSLRVAVSAGEPLGVPLARRAREFLGCPVLDGLGSTEVGQTFASNTLDVARDGTVGRALPPYRVSVRDPLGGPLPRGEVGALWVAGPTLPLGHVGEWLPTGDFAVLDADEFLHMRGRSDDVELVGGISVAPLEVEAVLSRHPCVTEVAVAGVVDPDGASRLRAFVVATAGAAGAGDGGRAAGPGPGRAGPVQGAAARSPSSTPCPGRPRGSCAGSCCGPAISRPPRRRSRRGSARRRRPRLARSGRSGRRRSGGPRARAEGWPPPIGAAAASASPSSSRPSRR